MATPDYTSRIYCAFDNITLEELNNLEINYEADPKEIATMTKGLAGKSEGVAKVRVSGTAAIPLGGPEYDFWTVCHEGSWATCQCGVGPKDYVGLGWFSSVKFSGSSDKPTEVSFEFTGKPGPME